MPLNGLFMGLMTRGPWKVEGWEISGFVVFEVAIVALYAPPEISTAISKVLAGQQLVYVIEHVIKNNYWSNEYQPVVACDISFVICVFVMVNY